MQPATPRPKAKENLNENWQNNREGYCEKRHLKLNNRRLKGNRKNKCSYNYFCKIERSYKKNQYVTQTPTEKIG